MSVSLSLSLSFKWHLLQIRTTSKLKKLTLGIILKKTTKILYRNEIKFFRLSAAVPTCLQHLGKETQRCFSPDVPN